MIRYARNINIGICLLWVLLLGETIQLIYSLAIGFFLAAFIAAFLLIAFAFFKIRKLILTDDSIIIDSYFLYGFRRKRIVIEEQFELKGEIFVNGDIDQVPDADPPFGFLIILVPFLYKKYALWIKTSTNKMILSLRLTKREFEILDGVRYEKILPLV